MKRKDENKNDEKKKENNSIIKEQLNNNSKLHIKIEENKNKKNGVIRNVNNVDLDKIKNLSVEDKERNEILMNKILNKNTKINEIFELINSPNSMRNKRNKKKSKEKNEIFIIENSYNSDSNRRKNSLFSPISDTKIKNRSKYSEIFDQINKIDLFNMKRKNKIISYSKNNYKPKYLFNSNSNYIPKKHHYSSSFSFFKNNFSLSPKNNKNYSNLNKILSDNNNNDFFNIKTNKLIFNKGRNRKLNNLNFDDHQLSYYYKNELLKFALMLKKGYSNRIHYPNFTCKNIFLNNNFSKKLEKKERIDKLNNW
jgi:hypothetical protein